MIGNDIVDFRQAALESNWQRRGYLDKLFCLEEQDLILNSNDPHQMVWLLWSMKEPAYKIYFREKLIKTYQPRNITCCNLFMDGNSATGQIHYDGRHYFSKSILNTDFVHTSAVTHHSVFSSLRIVIERNKVAYNDLNNNSREVINANCPSGYNISKDRDNIPNLLNEDSGEKLPISISRHGHFLSAIFLSNNHLV